jgi:nitroimidazol reductase NimA-like FMN-containing flavoprotein (pyridoxamine 5'-phosphate oxidase superfamily)
MSVRLSEDEAWAAIEHAHTATVTTLRRDGWPISLPVWFVVEDRNIYVSTAARSKKVARIRHDARACFQIESGLAWRELSAVVLPVTARLVDRTELIDTIRASFETKYEGFRTTAADMPAATQAHYAHTTAYIELVLTGRILSWDNSRITLGTAT